MAARHRQFASDPHRDPLPAAPTDADEVGRLRHHHLHRVLDDVERAGRIDHPGHGPLRFRIDQIVGRRGQAHRILGPYAADIERDARCAARLDRIAISLRDEARCQFQGELHGSGAEPADGDVVDMLSFGAIDVVVERLGTDEAMCSLRGELTRHLESPSTVDFASASSPI